MPSAVASSKEQPSAEPSRPLHIGRKFDGSTIDLTKIDELTDPKRKEFLINFAPMRGMLRPLLKREVDLPILYVMMSLTCTVVPLTLMLWYCEWHGDILSARGMHALGVLRVVLGVVQTEGFVLGIHYSSHKRIFAARFAFLDHWVHTVLSPLIGFPSNAYLAHHVLMHHKEDNALWYDASSTMPFQRDSWFHLLLYIVRYIALIQFELPVALMLRGRYRATGVMLAGYGTWFAVTWYGMKVMPFTAGYGLLVPFVFLSVAAMRGNNLQHIFVSPDEPDCDFKLCYDIVNDPSNCGKFLDSFHVEHHVSPATHWSDLPQKFIEFLPRHRDRDSFIFDSVHPDTVSWYVMTGQLERLADHYVHIGQKSGKDKATLVAEMRRRLKPIREFTAGKAQKAADARRERKAK
jgi:hypothetical protein